MALDKVLLGLGGAILLTVLAICWWQACQEKPRTKVLEEVPPAPLAPTGYTFQNSQGSFAVRLLETSVHFPQTPTLTLFVDEQGQATVSSAKTIYKPRIRRHHARYNIDTESGDQTTVPVTTPHTFWVTYSESDGLHLGLGTTPTPLSTLVVADTYVPLGAFRVEVSGSGVSNLTPFSLPSPGGACRWRLKKPWE